MTFRNPRPIQTLKPDDEVLLAGGWLEIDGVQIGLGAWRVGILNSKDGKFYLSEIQRRIELHEPDFWHPLPYENDDCLPLEEATDTLTEARLREIAEGLDVSPTNACPQALARQCLDLMKDLEAAQCDAANSLEVSVRESFRYQAALARAAAAEALLREIVRDYLGSETGWVMVSVEPIKKARAHLATAPQTSAEAAPLPAQTEARDG